MTDFHKLFMVKINKLIKKKTGGILLVVYLIYGSFVYTDSKKNMCCLLSRLPASYLLWNFSKVSKMQTCTHIGRFMSFHYVLDNQNCLVFVCFVQFNSQLDV